MKTTFRFYSDSLGFGYFDDLKQIKDYYTKEEFTEGNLSLLCGATVVQYLDVETIAEVIYN
jgi:hypothetical protein